MRTETPGDQESVATEIEALYRQVLSGWNERNAEEMAGPFAEDGEVIGFDGSEMIGRAEIAATLRQIFADHVVAPYVAKVRSVQLLAPGVALLRAVAGMVPPGQSAINPKVNTHHTLVAVKSGGAWQVKLYQNTPAQFHGRPDLVERLTAELQALV